MAGADLRGDLAETSIHLVRHAPHPAVGERLCGREPGHGLRAPGREMAARLGAAMQLSQPAMVYASPVQRAVETGQAIAKACGVPLQIAEALTEIDFGQWTGKRFEDLQGDPGWTRWNCARASACVPGGESMAEVQARTSVWIEQARARHPGQSIVAVSHADVIKAVLAEALGWSLDRHDRLQIDTASVSRIVAADWGRRVLSINEAIDGPTDAGRDQDEGAGARRLVPQP